MEDFSIFTEYYLFFVNNRRTFCLLFRSGCVIFCFILPVFIRLMAINLLLCKIIHLY